MTRRIFVTVTRGMTDKTAVCVFPWEKRLLESIHGGDVKEVSIDDMCSMKDVAKIEKIKIPKRDPGEPEHEAALSLREQLDLMATVDPEDDPVNDPSAEYGRLADKYGMDKDIPLPVVTRIYGEFDSGAFEAALRATAKGRPAPAVKKSFSKPPEEMTVLELKEALKGEGIDFDPDAKKAALLDLLVTATA